MLGNFSETPKEKYHLFTFLFSKFISTLGTSIYEFGLSFYILYSTGSALLFSINLAVGALPVVFISLITGYVVDKYNKKKIAIGFQLVNIIAVTSLLLVIYYFGISIIAIYITTAILSITGSFIRTTFTSSIPNLFSKKNIQFVLGINQSTLSMAGILGPVIGGIIFGLLGKEILLLCFIIGFGISTILDATMNFELYAKDGGTANESKSSTMKDSIVSGLKYSFGNKVITSLLLVAVFANFFASALIVGLNKVLVTHFHMAAHYVGSMEGLIAFGTMLGGILISIKKNFQRPIGVTKNGMLIVAVIILAMSSPFILNMNHLQVLITYGILLFSFGLIIQFVNTPLFVFLQKNVDENYRGRVFSLLEMNAMLLSPLSFVIFGLLFDMELYNWIFISSGLLTLLAVIWILRPSITRVTDFPQTNEEVAEGMR